MKCIKVVLCVFLIIKQIDSLPRKYRQAPEELPQLAANLFHEYQQQQFTIPPNINLNNNLQNNFQFLASQLIQTVKKTISLWSNNNGFTFNPETIIQDKIEKEIGEHFTQRPTTTTTELTTTTKNYKAIKAEVAHEFLKKGTTETVTEITSRSMFPETVNTEVKNINFFKELTLPEEKSLNIFLTKNLESIPELNASELSLPAHDSVNVFLLNGKSDVQKVSSINLPDTPEDIASNMYKVIYNFPLPIVEKISKFKQFENVETSTASSFQTISVKFGGNNEPNTIVPDNVNVFELPAAEKLENFEGKIKSGVDYSSLSEIPLEESPVFDLNKKDLVNSYGKKITTFKK